MSYRVRLGNRARRDLRSLDKNVSARIKSQLAKLKSDPRPHGTKQLAQHMGAELRVRVGDWRILYTVDDQTKEVRIYRIRHRSKAY